LINASAVSVRVLSVRLNARKPHRLLYADIDRKHSRQAPVNSMFNLGAPGTVAIVDSSFAVSSTIRYTAQAMSVSVLEFTAR
jgi:hypothetical protein